MEHMVIPKYRKYDEKWQSEVIRLVKDTFVNFDELYDKGGKDSVIRQVFYYMSRIFGKGYIDKCCPFVTYMDHDGYVEMDFVEDLINHICAELEKRFREKSKTN